MTRFPGNRVAKLSFSMLDRLRPGHESGPYAVQPIGCYIRAI